RNGSEHQHGTENPDRQRRKGRGAHSALERRDRARRRTAPAGLFAHAQGERGRRRQAHRELDPREDQDLETGQAGSAGLDVESKEQKTGGTGPTTHPNHEVEVQAAPAVCEIVQKSCGSTLRPSLNMRATRTCTKRSVPSWRNLRTPF